MDGKFGVWGLNSEKIKKIYEIEAHQVILIYFMVFIKIK